MEEIFVKYWNQILILITAFGIGLKILFNYLLKKKEINHSILHKNRMDSLRRFYNDYATLNSMWIKLPIYQIFKHEIPSIDIDKMIQPPLNRFEASVLELQLYFESDLFEMFKEIEKNMLSMNGHYLKLAFDFNPNTSTINKANNYEQFRSNIEKQNTELIKEISKTIRKNY